MSIFDPNTFLDTATVEGQMETKRTPIPEGDQYMGVIDELMVRKAKERIILDVLWNILDDNLKASLGLSKVIVRQSCFLDFDVNGKLAVGPNMNITLGRIRDAVGQNVPGQAWGPRMLKGAGPAKLKITQRPDEKDATIIYNDVAAVTKLAA